MKTTKTLVPLVAAALAALFIASTGIEPAMARHGDGGGSFGGGRSGGGSARSFSAPSHSFSRGARSGGTHHFSRTYRSPSSRSPRVYGYISRGGHHRHHHGHRGRGGVFVYGYPYDYYAYSDSCARLHRRALATGSSYWWNRYYDCIDDY